uniref:DRBM domain-containing protein n=1 Tax=Macrostomum lignano TaxID=282301 RepID=A0A1I8J3F7_9PLAT
RDWLMQKSEQPSSEAKLQRAFSSLSLGQQQQQQQQRAFSSGGLWPNSRPEVAIRQSQALVAAFPVSCGRLHKHINSSGGKARPQKHRAETSESAKTAGGDDGGVSTTQPTSSLAAASSGRTLRMEMAKTGQAAVQTGQAEGKTGQAAVQTGQAEGKTGQAVVQTGQAAGKTGQAEGKTGQAEGKTGQAEGKTGQAVVQTGQAEGKTGQAVVQTGQAEGKTGQAVVQTGQAEGKTGQAAGHPETRPIRQRPANHGRARAGPDSSNGLAEGQGLGRQGEGRVEPVAVAMRTGRAGLASDGEKTGIRPRLPQPPPRPCPPPSRQPPRKKPDRASAQARMHRLGHLSQKYTGHSPRYRLIREVGPPGAKMYLYSVTALHCTYQAGQFRPSRWLAKAAAAELALRHLDPGDAAPMPAAQPRSRRQKHGR